MPKGKGGGILGSNIFSEGEKKRGARTEKEKGGTIWVLKKCQIKKKN